MDRKPALNDAQRSAVQAINGPVMVIAGPGTGKTELLSARVAEILQQTDADPQNILCLTFTDAGADAMRRRLIDRIGQAGYKVPVHTFHGFAADVASRYREYFNSGAELTIVDDLQRHQLISTLIDGLNYDSPLKASFNGQYTTLGDTQTAISDIKRSGLAPAELEAVLDAAQQAIDAAEPLLQAAIGARISAGSAAGLAKALQAIQAINEPQPIASIPRWSTVIASSLAAALTDAEAHPRTTPPLTAWKDQTMTKSGGELVLRSRKRIDVLRAVIPVMADYQAALAKLELHDYDDLVLSLIAALDHHEALRYDLQERYQYLMIDEFQDTNLAQMRIIEALTSSPAHEGQPNLMVVGDDDQAIYSFQGAEVGNILTFMERFPAAKQVVLTENYRSPEIILRAAENVIGQGGERLANRIDGLSKQLSAHAAPDAPAARVTAYDSQGSEQAAVAQSVADLLASDVAPQNIALIAKQHSDLTALLPQLVNHGIPLSYEKRENVLDNESVQQLLLLVRIIGHVVAGRPDLASTLLPELLAHPAWGVPAETLWQLGLESYQSKRLWIDLIATYPDTADIAAWLQSSTSWARQLPLERLLDQLLGQGESVTDFTSPLKNYFFDPSSDSDYSYIDHLDSLLALRDALRAHYSQQPTATLGDLVRFIDLVAQTKTRITRVRHVGSTDQAVQLLTAHGAKGLEFDHVFIVNATDQRWGEKARGRSSVISYPENLRLKARTNSYDERLRLFFVAMTRAKQQLNISYAVSSHTGKPQLLAGFLAANPALQQVTDQSNQSADQRLEQAEARWYEPIVNVSPTSLQQALSNRLANYKLSATDLNAYLDVSRGGPQAFLLNNLLRFPSAMSPHAAYGSAIHAVLQQAHAHIRSGQPALKTALLLDKFEQALAGYALNQTDLAHFRQQGRDSLQLFFDQHYDSFAPNQLTEVNFASQQVSIGQANLTGKLDLITLDDSQKTIDIVDYKTGRAFPDWGKGGPYDKLKSHHYRQQLLFYQLLVAKSRDYSNYAINSSAVQFVEPDSSGTTRRISLVSSDDDIERLSKLIKAVWQRIINCDFPDTSQYPDDISGVMTFEQFILDNID